MAVRRMIAYSLLVEAAISVVLIATFKIANDLWDPDGFGAWVLARRILAFALPLATIGIETALPRYLAFDVTRAPADYLLAATAIVLTGMATISTLLFAAPDFFTSILFGDASLRRFLLPLWAVLTAYPVHVLVFAYVRGHLRILEANLLQLWALAVAPLLAFNFATDSPEHAMTTIAVLVALPPAVLLAIELLRKHLDFSQAFDLGRTLVTFGMSRMLSALGLMMLALIPPLIVARQSGLGSAGAVALGVTLVGLAASLMSPIALTLLPVAARQSGRGDATALRVSMKAIEIAAFPVALAAFAVVWLLAPWLAETFLTSQAETGRQILRIAGAGIGSYAVFILTRSIVDAITEKARVFQSTLIACAVFAATWYGGRYVSVMSTSVLAITSYVCAVTALAVSAYWFALSGVGAIQQKSAIDTDQW